MHFNLQQFVQVLDVRQCTFASNINITDYRDNIKCRSHGFLIIEHCQDISFSKPNGSSPCQDSVLVDIRHNTSNETFARVGSNSLSFNISWVINNTISWWHSFINDWRLVTEAKKVKLHHLHVNHFVATRNRFMQQPCPSLLVGIHRQFVYTNIK